jgi:glycine reductase
MSRQLRVLHFVNQFFGGVGGEEHAGQPPELRKGPVGPGRLLAQLLDDGQVAATLICGDNYFHDHREQAVAAVREAIAQIQPDVVLAGPAFLAGRYGIACGEVCSLAQELGVPAVTGMHAENPAVTLYRPRVYIVSAGGASSAMEASLRVMLRLARKLASGVEPGPAADEGYLPRGTRVLGSREQAGAVRAVEMLVAKLKGEPFVSEIPYQPVDLVVPAHPLADPSAAAIALISTGGLIRKGNPDRVPSSNARQYVRIDVTGMSELRPEDYEAYHAGYLNEHASSDPNYILPLRYARILEQEGVIGRVHRTIYALPGVSTPVAQAKRLGEEIARELREADVGAALLVAT